MRTKRTVGAMSALLALSVAVAGDAVGPGEAGPTNGGLRLRLRVTTSVVGGEDVHTVRLDVLNVGTTPAVLVAEWFYEEGKGDYAEFLKATVKFLTFPEVEPESAQTAGRERKSPQPERTIEPGGTLAVEWTAKGRRLKPEDYFNTAPYFPTPGLYGVRARVVVLTKGGKRVLLTSNEQPVVVGGSLEMPKYAVAHVMTASPDEKTVSLDLGSDQRLEKGDQFTIRYGLAASWRVTITEVYPGGWGCKGNVVAERSVGQGVPAFPGLLWPATLIPPKERDQGR